MPHLTRHILSLFIFAGGLLFSSTASAQTDSTTIEVVQVSGLVVTGDSLMPLAYATVYRVSDSRGTMTDSQGFFSLPILEGDTLRFSSTGYISREVMIPHGGERSRISLVQPMGRDTIMINNAYIYPWPSRDAFKKDFMALGLDDDMYAIGEQALDPFDIYDRLIDVGLDGQAASTQSLRQMSQDYSHQGSVPTTNLLNPVAWARFIQAIKNGDLKGN
ncbi:MAG TPA: carboxypeptidase-like regulatory domain-containing protein [Flavobacteriales bacterium]|nr:carboxypeptidase-like regulatory domain-containing protein [Flavobacteriales bacterium]HIN41775.1 carboxypeptidase-like regulatory domain-containing protein [Flavobacteriales bacterium]